MKPCSARTACWPQEGVNARTRYRRRNRRSLLAYRMLAVAVFGLRIEAPKMTNYPTMTAITGCNGALHQFTSV
jgi:hypothetical protein